MNMMSDNELDALLSASAERKRALHKINMEVMRSVKREERRKSLRKWAGIIAYCFATPLMVLAYFYVLSSVQLTLPLPILIAVYVLPLMTILPLVTKKLNNINL